MKLIYCILLILLVLPTTFAADSISTAEFKNITDPEERQKIIEQAPPEQKEQLKQIDLHLRLLDRWGGEKGLKLARETQIARARGLGGLEDVFINQTRELEGYIGNVLNANQKAGVSPEKQAEVYTQLIKERDVLHKRLSIVHSLVFNMAPSQKALELEKKAENLSDGLSKTLVTDGSTPSQPITKAEHMETAKQLDQIFEDMKKLPTLTPEQVQKEYDAFTDDKVRPW